MRGLILKDLYTLFKQMWIFLLMIVLFACIPGNFSVSSFAIVYAALLPITALAYDERSKWNQLAVMMPYSVKSLVWSKYVLGYILIGGAAVISAAAQLVMALVSQIPLGAEKAMGLLLIVCIAVILQSVNLPLMFKFGVEKGRITFIIMLAATAAVLFALQDDLFIWVAKMDGSVTFVLGVCVAVAIGLNWISVAISQKVYN